MSKTMRRLVAGTVAAACVLTPAAAIAGGKAEKMRARMTGGGHILGWNAEGQSVKVTHGFELHCRTATKPQRLQVNWSGGNSFHLTELEDSYCNEEGYDEENPRAPFDTYYGEGTGRITTRDGGKETGYAIWRFVDDGEPGGANEDGGDELSIQVFNSDDELIMWADGTLTKGNHQAHRGTGSKA